MKTAQDPRHRQRIRTFKYLFAHTFNKQFKYSTIASQIIKNLDKVDKIIQQCAPEWPINQINKVDLSVLRLAIWELLKKKKTPVKVIIDEAVEIAKRYGSQNSGSFVNGALASAIPLTRPKFLKNNQLIKQKKNKKSKIIKS